MGLLIVFTHRYGSGTEAIDHDPVLLKRTINILKNRYPDDFEFEIYEVIQRRVDLERIHGRSH